MITLIAFVLMLAVFYAGIMFAANTVGATLGLGLAAIAFGILIAAAQTRGFEGQTLAVDAPYTWTRLIGDIYRLSERRGRITDQEKIYLQTPLGPRPVTGLFTARINHELGIVFESVDEDATHTFNALKQGVM